MELVFLAPPDFSKWNSCLKIVNVLCVFIFPLLKILKTFSEKISFLFIIEQTFLITCSIYPKRGQIFFLFVLFAFEKLKDKNYCIDYVIIFYNHLDVLVLMPGKEKSVYQNKISSKLVFTFAQIPLVLNISLLPPAMS